MSHCDTCICGDGKGLDGINGRIRKLIKEGRIGLSNADEQIVSRLVDDPKFQFGFRDFLPSYESSRICGVFLCGLKDPFEYFVVVIPAPYSGLLPKPVQYKKGDCWDVFDSPYGEDFVEIQKMTDDELVWWISNSLMALYDYVRCTVLAKPDGEW